tara:strand:- start:1941 stop:2099 length:159 start_codon:yes stop_codon:yes gene_type:complete
MPYKITKLKNNKYQVKNTENNKIASKGTTKTKAEKQVKLLYMLDKKKKDKSK